MKSIKNILALQDDATHHTIQKWSELSWTSHWLTFGCWVLYRLLLWEDERRKSNNERRRVGFSSSALWRYSASDSRERTQTWTQQSTVTVITCGGLVSTMSARSSLLSSGFCVEPSCCDSSYQCLTVSHDQYPSAWSRCADRSRYLGVTTNGRFPSPPVFHNQSFRFER